MWDSRIGKIIELIQRALDVTVIRRRLIASNVANADTPRYKAVDIDFRSTLEAAIEGSSPLEPIRTHPQHLSSPNGGALPWVRLVASEGDPFRQDGNTVDLEREIVKMAENQLRFNTLVQVLLKKFSLLKESITEGGRR